MNTVGLSERDICTKFITPALRRAGWDEMLQIREEYPITRGRIIVRGKLVPRGRARRADYVLNVRPNVPIAVSEEKNATFALIPFPMEMMDAFKALSKGSSTTDAPTKDAEE